MGTDSGHEPTEGLNADIEEPVPRVLERPPGETGADVEDGAEYERAVVEDTVVAPTGDDPGAGPDAPEFREPGT